MCTDRPRVATRPAVCTCDRRRRPRSAAPAGHWMHPPASPPDSPRSRRWRLVLTSAVALTAGAFALDVRIPLGYAGGMLYVVPVLLGLWMPDRRLTIAIAAVATALTVAGYFASDGAPTVIVLLNRGGAILALWIVAVGVLLYGRAQEGHAHKARELEHTNARLAGENTHRRPLEGSLRDVITELEHKNAELERFTYTVSHNLKSPLITIKGFLGMLDKDLAEGNTERLGRDADRIAKAAERMEQLLDELLELSRIGRLVNPPEDVPLGELVEETLEMLSGPVEARGVTVEVAPDLPVVHGDRMRIREVVQNLLENATKFLGDRPEPRIEIGVRRNGEAVCFVRDNGIGIDPRYTDKVFGLFERLSHDGEGSGVGLTVVKQIVEVHGGRIWVESEGLGKGACFYFTLPEAEGSEAASQGDDDERQAGNRSAGRGQ